MNKNTDHTFFKIALFVILGTMFFVSPSCKRDRSSTYRAASLGISADDYYPSWSPDGTRIVFFSDRDGNYEIYTMNPDGSEQTRLTENPEGDRNPCWSPDGKKIAFVTERDGNVKIYIMNSDGSNETRLTENLADDFSPSWSPDGSKIIFGSNRDGNAEIYIMNADGSDQTRLTDEPANDGHPSWSPDGTRIVFHSYRDGNYEIYTMKADGSNPTRLTNEPAKDILPSWSPDGTRIAFVSERDFIHEVYVMDTDGTNTVRLTHNAPVNETVGLAPVPQSELDLEEIIYRIVFQSYRETDGKENWEICLIDADGSDLINLTNTSEIDERYPHASPDGRQICFVVDEGEDKESKSRNVYYMNIDGTGRVKITENAYQPCWSADGRYLAYLPGEYPRYNPRVFANKGIEIYDLKTGGAKRHPNDKIIHLNQLCWSPDGEWFVAAGRGPITAYKADDKTQMYLRAPGCTPDISPSGKRIAWNGSDFSLNIGALDLDSPLSNVTDHRMVVACDQDHWIYHADWSPDEKYFVFTYGFEDESKPKGKQEPWSHICICDLKTGKWTQITTDGKYNEEPDWVPVQEN
jgi:Tol biopolymer transport system component